MDPKKKKLFKRYKWLGQDSKDLQITVRYKGNELTNPILKCEKCGNQVNLDFLINEEGGVALAKVMLEMKEEGKRCKQLNELEAKMERERNLHKYFIERDGLMDKFYRVGTATSSHLAELFPNCPDCLVPLGKVEVHLELTVLEATFKAHTYEYLYELAKNIPKKIAAQVGHELGYRNFQSLRDFVENPHLSELEKLAKEFQEKLATFNISEGIIYDFNKQLDNLVANLPKESQRRKRMVVEKVQEIAKSDAAGR